MPEVIFDEPLLTRKEIAERLRRTESWVREQMRERTRERQRHPLPCVYVGRQPMFLWSQVSAWLLTK
jgi:hypothetical protein